MQEEEVGKSKLVEQVNTSAAEDAILDAPDASTPAPQSETPINTTESAPEPEPAPEEIEPPAEMAPAEPEPPKLPDGPVVPTAEDAPAVSKAEEPVVIPVPPVPEPSSLQPAEEATVVEQVPEVTAPDKNGIPQKVLDLSPDELDAARRLWASRTIHDTQKASVEARKERVRTNTDRVEHFVKKYGPTSVRTVALELGMSTRSASAYLVGLANQGKLKATGTTTNRRYS
jgi:hypothetical protein